jgi:Zn-dependent peptidase ImmA (M78 family)
MAKITALHLRQYLGLDERAPNLDDVVRRLGIQLEYVVAPGWSGAVESAPDGRAVIWIDSTDAVTRRRFTIAHELGHLFLHPLGQQFRDSTFLGNSQERQANLFAADFLMPKWMVDGDFRSAFRSVVDLAEMYRVSPDVMRIHLQYMRLHPMGLKECRDG